MFGVGAPEVLIILVVALVIFGPSRLPELAGQVGRWVREFRRMSADLTGEFEKTFAEVEEVRQSVRRELQGMRDEVEGVSRSVKQDLTGTAPTRPAAPSTASVARPATARAAAKPATAANGSVKGVAAVAATKADPLADVSFLDDVVVKPGRATNGASPNGEADDALARVRRRRAAAGYARRA